MYDLCYHIPQVSGLPAFPPHMYTAPFLSSQNQHLPLSFLLTSSEKGNKKDKWDGATLL